VQDPFTLDSHWHVPRELNIPAMRRAARMLLGRHDFATFTSNPGYERESTFRTMKRASLVREGEVLVFHFTANGFLYRMVRNLVGAIVRVGMGKISVEDFGKILRARKRSEAPATAPACGLYLMNVTYPKSGTHLPPRTDDPIE
jgi:tRNA pseudouridine38-40 synthase